MFRDLLMVETMPSNRVPPTFSCVLFCRKRSARGRCSAVAGFARSVFSFVICVTLLVCCRVRALRFGWGNPMWASTRPPHPPGQRKKEKKKRQYSIHYYIIVPKVKQGKNVGGSNCWLGLHDSHGSCARRARTNREVQTHFVFLRKCFDFHEQVA